MKQECLSCRNALRFFDGECECIFEPEVYGGKRRKDSDTCEKYDAVEETVYEERVAWKQREMAQFLLEKVNEICNQPDYDKNKYRFIRLDWLENNNGFLENAEIK